MADRGVASECERAKDLDGSTAIDLDPFRSALRDDSLLMVGVEDKDEVAESGMRRELVRVTVDCSGLGNG